jgi:hypothetical protein
MGEVGKILLIKKYKNKQEGMSRFKKGNTL